jgi:hypothetical protein
MVANPGGGDKPLCRQARKALGLGYRRGLCSTARSLRMRSYRSNDTFMQYAFAFPHLRAYPKQRSIDVRDNMVGRTRLTMCAHGVTGVQTSECRNP